MVRFLIPLFLLPLAAFAGTTVSDNFAAYNSYQCYDPGVSGNKITIQAPTLAAGWTLTLPTTAGTANYCLQTNGSGVTTWADPIGNLSLGAFGSTPNADGLSLSSDVLNMQPADGTHPGGVSTTTQTIAGAKTFSSTPTFSTMTANSVLFAGTGGLLSQDNTNFTYADSTGLLTLGNGAGANTAGIKITDSGGDQITLVDGGTSRAWGIGAQSNQFFIIEGTNTPLAIGSTSNPTWALFNTTGGTPEYSFHIDRSATSTTPAADFKPNSGQNLAVAVIQNADTTVNNWSGLGFAGNAINNTSATAIDGAIVTTHEVHTAGSETGHMDFMTRNAGGTLTSGFTVNKDQTTAMPHYGAGAVMFDSSGNISSNTTTGSGNSVLATAPTMTNPVVGTQSTGDNSTKAASTAFVQTALAQLNPAAAVFAASTANIVGTYTNAVSGVCIGDTFTVTATGALTIDGQTPGVGKRVLLKNQSSAFQNGVWDVTVAGTTGVSPVLTRSADWDTSADMNAGNLIPVINGTANANTVWYQTATVSTCSSDSQVFTQFSGGGGGSSVCTPLVKTGNYTIVSGDFTSCQILEVRMNCSAACTLTLLSPSGSGKITKVKNVTANQLTVSGTLDGDTSYIMTQQYQAAEFDDIGGSEWSVF